MNNSKLALSLIVGASAALAAGTLGATSAKAQLTNMLQSGVQRPTAGITIGQTTMAKGTIQYTNSAGTNDSFSVGTSTSIAANASASSTSDYSVTSIASFDMGNNNTEGPGGLSVISQQIGRAQQSSQTKALDTTLATNLAETASKTAAEATASQFKVVAINDFTDVNGKSYQKGEIDISQMTEESVISLTAGNANIEVSYWNNNQWDVFEDTTSTDSSGNTVVDESALEKFEGAYTSASAMNYEEAFTSAVSEASFAASGSGIISGEFVKNAGYTIQDTFSQDSQVKAGTGEIVTGADFESFEVTSQAAADYADFKQGSSGNGTTQTVLNGETFDFTKEGVAEVFESTAQGETFAVDSEYFESGSQMSINDSTYALDTVSVQTASFRQIDPTTNVVSVQGINSENNIVSDDSAEFSSTITKDLTAGVETTSGTATGSATGNVSTTASASASSSSFINSFVQAY